MAVVRIIIVLIVIGVLLWLVNTQIGSYIDYKILKLINIVTVIGVVSWLLSEFTGWTIRDIWNGKRQ